VDYPYAAEWWGGSVRRLYPPSDAEIFDAHISKSNKSRGFIQLWGSLECDLDFRSKNWKSVYCVRIANFLLEYVTDRHPESGKFRGHYLVVERAGPLSLR
jgi:hypothetical protein